MLAGLLKIIFNSYCLITNTLNIAFTGIIELFSLTIIHLLAAEL